MRPHGLGLTDVDPDFDDRSTSGCAVLALVAGYALLGAGLVWLAWELAGWLIGLVGG